MEQRIGSIDLVSWQDRRNRRARPGVPAWAVVVGLAALSGGAALVAQVCGLPAWAAGLAAVSAGFVLLAICAQLLTVARAAVAWIVG